MICSEKPTCVLMLIHYGHVDDTTEDDPSIWFYAVDNKSRAEDDPTQPTDPVLKEVRKKLDEIVHNDDRTMSGLDGTPTRYLDFQMPIGALHMIGYLRAEHGRVSSMQQVNDAAELFSFNQAEVELLLDMFKQLGMVLHFPEIEGCNDFIVLDAQWLIDAMSCLIREEKLHGSLLRELREDYPTEGRKAWHRTPTGAFWSENDVQRGWFSVGLLDFIWGHKTKYKKLSATTTQLEYLKKVLTHFNLVHRVTRKDGIFFVVPALVPMAPMLPTPPSLKVSEQLPQMPACVAWELHRVRQKYGQKVGVFDFQFDFTGEDFFPNDIFESLVCAVATEISGEFSKKAVDPSVNFYRQEATFAFNEHYIHAKKDGLTMQVYSINCGAENYSTARYSLKLFRECADDLLRQTIYYDVKLGYVNNGHYTYSSALESDLTLAPSAVANVWHGELNLSNSDRTWKKQVNDGYQYHARNSTHVYRAHLRVHVHTYWGTSRPQFCP